MAKGSKKSGKVIYSTKSGAINKLRDDNFRNSESYKRFERVWMTIALKNDLQKTFKEANLEDLI